MSNRSYSTTSTMFISPYSHAEQVTAPDKALVDTLHKLLDFIKDDNLALSIDYCVAQLLRVSTPPNGMFMPELIAKGVSHD